MLVRSRPTGRRCESPATLLTLFLVLAGVPLAALGWVGSQLIAQDRALDAQRVRERLENAATLVAVELDRHLAAWGGLLPAAARGDSVSLPGDAVFLLVDSRGVLRQQGVRLPYYPAVPVSSQDHAPLFTEAELLEFGPARNLQQASATYRTLARSKDSAVRAAALMRLGRVLRQNRRSVEARVAYGQLAALTDTAVAGMPAELVARRERMVLLAAEHDADGAAREAAWLATAHRHPPARPGWCLTASQPDWRRAARSRC